ncbi:MAG: ATPase, T2SS/T4P/T4SS family, partial [Patescibacteria group bacterium]
MVVSRVSSKKTSHDDSHIHLSSDKGQELSSTLHDIREKEKELITSEEAHRFGFPYINLANFPIPQDALLMLDRGFCERERMVCFYFENEQIRLGALDPTADMVLKKAAELEEKFRSDVAIYKISEDSLRVAFKKYDAIPKTIRSREEGFELSEEALKKQQEKVTSIKELNEAIAVAPVTELLALIIGAAMKANASDIHIEAEADDIKVRMRIDGVLHDLASLPRESWNKVVSRIKLISALKLNIIDQPQDGRFTILLTNDKIEVRVSTVPTSYGESVVMRLLRFYIESLAFPRLGLTGFTLSILEQEIGKPNGMIIATGPTGSGKTTT